MSLREIKRLKAVQEAIDWHITQRAAASVVGLSERQVRRLVSAVRHEGNSRVGWVELCETQQTIAINRCDIIADFLRPLFMFFGKVIKKFSILFI